MTIYTFGRYCRGAGCWNVVIHPDYRYCDDCLDRVRDLVAEAAREYIAAADLILGEETA